MLRGHGTDQRGRRGGRARRGVRGARQAGDDVLAGSMDAAANSAALRRPRSRRTRAGVRVAVARARRTRRAIKPRSVTGPSPPSVWRGSHSLEREAQSSSRVARVRGRAHDASACRCSTRAVTISLRKAAVIAEHGLRASSHQTMRWRRSRSADACWKWTSIDRVRDSTSARREEARSASVAQRGCVGTPGHMKTLRDGRRRSRQNRVDAAESAVARGTFAGSPTSRTTQCVRHASWSVERAFPDGRREPKSRVRRRIEVHRRARTQTCSKTDGPRATPSRRGPTAQTRRPTAARAHQPRHTSRWSS